LVTPAAFEDVVKLFERVCGAAGFDLVHPFNVGTYNASVDQPERLVTFEEPNALGVLIGNTRALWPKLTRAFEANPSAYGRDPVDAYTTESLLSIAPLLGDLTTRFLFSHIKVPHPYPIQRLAERVGFATLSPSHLAIHPLHGPWIALRAVAVIDVPGPTTPLPVLRSPCERCDAPCLPKLQQALSTSPGPLTSAAIAANASAWIAVRDACPVGRSSRYGSAQLAYHYAPSLDKIRP
jgi:hypothetical protein